MNEELTNWKWLATEEGNDAILSMPLSPSTAQIAAIRKTLSAEQVRVVSEGARARTKALKKLDPSFTSKLIADIAGVEMASSSISSLYKAKRFAATLGDNAVIADLCCGIGGDSWGFGEAGLNPIGVDLDPVRVWMYQNNTGYEALCGDAEEAFPSGIHGFHLDPARRSVEGKRTLDVEDFEPGPDCWERLIQIHSTGAIKLNPGVNAYELPDGECEILSEPAGLTQAVLWIGGLAGEHDRRATKLGANGSVCTITGQGERPEDSNEIGAFLGTLDPCLERADLVGEFLNQTGTSLVHPGTGMVTTEQSPDHAMVRWHRVYEVMKWNRKRVKAALRGLDAGVVEVRTRGGVVNPDVEQKYLRGKGKNNKLTALIYRIDDQLTAVIAERVEQQKTPHKNVLARSDEGGC